VQLQAAKARFEAQGLKLAAISYDNEAILKDFAQRHKIDFPLLANPDSEVIQQFRVLNVEAKGMTKGMAYPGYFYIDSSGIIRDKYFEDKYTDRFTANNVIGKLFPELTEEVSQTIDEPHLRLTLSQSDLTAFPGSRVTLMAEITLPPNVHVYSPGVHGYKPIQLDLDTSGGFQPAAPADYPAPTTLYLEAIQEKVPVFEGRFKITQDVIVNASKLKLLYPGTRQLSIQGDLKYQACDKTICYPPTSVPVKWELKVLPIDLKRSPDAIQHKADDSGS